MSQIAPDGVGDANPETVLHAVDVVVDVVLGGITALPSNALASTMVPFPGAVVGMTVARVNES